MTSQEAAGGTCFCAGMLLQVQGRGSLTGTVGTAAASHQLKEGGVGAGTAFVLAPRQQQANKLEASKMKRLQKRKNSSSGVRTQV